MSEWLTNFHFLRPELLLLLPLALLPLALLRSGKRVSNTWESLLPPEFLHALAPTAGKANRRLGYWRWPVLLILAIAALAGPTWSKQQTPLLSQQQPLVIVFDLSLSMLATDQSPNRLTRARQKVHDLIGLRKEGQTGLVVFAGSGHTVSPLTEDITTLRAYLPALDPFIMPQFGSNPASGVARAIDLLAQAGAPSGRILMLADGLEQNDIDRIADLLASSPYQLSLIALGTANGGPIPIPEQGFLKENDAIVVTKPDFAAMQALISKTNGLFAQVTIDNRDLLRVLPELSSINLSALGPAALPPSLNSAADLTTSSEQWHDSGYWLLLVLVPLVIWQYRQAGISLLLVIVCMPTTTKALEWQDLWKTPDQQASEAYNLGQYADAASRFEDQLWSGTAHYKAGQYDQALAAFAQQDTAISHYNRGNTLVELQRFEEALQAYDQALKLDPELARAEENKRKLSQWLEQQKQTQNQQQQQQQQQQQGQDNAASSDDKNTDNSQQQQQEKQQEKGTSSAAADSAQSAQSHGQQSASQPATEQPMAANSKLHNQSLSQRSDKKDGADPTTGTDSNSVKQPQPAADDAESARPQAETAQTDSDLLNATEADSGADQRADAGQDLNSAERLTSLKDQQTEQWLRRIPDDPGGLLRRKFLQQYRDQGSGGSRSEADESRSLW